MASTEFRPVARVDEIPPGAVVSVQLGETALAVANVDGKFFATEGDRRPRPHGLLPAFGCRTLGIASAATRTTTATTPTSASVHRPQANQAMIPTPTTSETKLDCENEKTSPTNAATTTAAAP
jgi:hypothetical protein